MTSIFEIFKPLGDLVQQARLPLVSRTIIIGGVAMLDWELQQAARMGADEWDRTERTTEDIDIVIAAADDRGWLETLTAAGWQQDDAKAYRWTSPEQAGEHRCVVDLLGQFRGAAGGKHLRLKDYWGGEDGAYICRVLRAYQGKDRFPLMLIEPFWDGYMRSFGWQRLNHMGLLLSKISAVGIVLQQGDSEVERGTAPVSRLRKDLQDLSRLLDPRIRDATAGWLGEVVLDELVSKLGTEIRQHLALIRAIAAGDQASEHAAESEMALLSEVAGILPDW